MTPAQTPTRTPHGTNVPATTAAARKDVRSLIEGPAFRAEIAKVLPRHMTAERMIRVALTATMKTPKLLLCTADSLTRCLLDCSAIGLEPDGRRAHLIPFEDKKAGTVICTLIIDYKGLVELAMRSGLVSYLYADVVREGDLFEFSLGEIKRHVPWFLRRDEDRPLEAGQDIAVYAYARMANGASAVAVMSIEEVYSIRDGSQGWQAFKKGFTKKNPWDPSDWVSEQEMKKKTALRRLCKMMPQSPELRDAVEKDDEHDDIKPLIDVTPRQPLFNPPAAPSLEGQDTPQRDSAQEEQQGAADNAQDPQPATEPTPTSELDVKREKIEKAFLAAGLNFDSLVAFLASRGQDVAETSFGELPEPVVNRLTRALDSFVKQAKQLKEGGAV
jgi:recombination protein RecT